MYLKLTIIQSEASYDTNTHIHIILNILDQVRQWLIIWDCLSKLWYIYVKKYLATKKAARKV